jgi:hypothetical protein
MGTLEHPKLGQSKGALDASGFVHGSGNPVLLRKIRRMVSKVNELQNHIENDIVYRLKRRAEIRRQIPGRRSVQEGKADRIADLLDEAAEEILRLRKNSKT